MRSLLGRFHRPMSRGLVNNMLTMNNLGDGSTLNLDFTTMGGVLDPRLTFSRASTATFVNSSGYVQFANANCFTYSNPRNLTTAWNATGTVTWNGTGGIVDPIGGTNAQSITFGTAASAIFNTAGTIVTSGINHTFSVWLRAASGTTNARIGSSNTGAVSTVALTTTWQRFSCQYVTNGTNDGGAVYSQTGTASAEMYVWGAQLQPGSIVGDLIQTSGTQNYSTPRFDYSPTNIGEPRGLLIEGQGVNLTTYSEDFANAAWTKSGLAQTPASGISPDNSNTATLIAENAGGFIKHSLERSVTVTAGSVYTWSVFLKEASSNSRRYACVQVADGQATAARNTVVFDLQTGTVTANGVNNGTAGAPTDVAYSITPYRDGWYRVSVTMKYVSSPCYPTVILSDISTLYGGSNQPFYTATVPYKGLLVYGAQLEAGSGASSYIPTGASQVTRNADICYMSDISSLSYSATNGSMVYEGLFFQINSASYPTRMGFLTAAGGDPAFEIFVNGTTIFSGIRSVPANNEITRTIATNTNYKFATSFNAAASSQVRCSINGAAVVGSGSSALTATRTPTVFGFTRSGYELYFPSGTIKSAKYWNTTLTDADLVSKST